jgi:2-phospho-L-lactate guanylyltransferase
MQGTIATFDPDTRAGTLLLDDGTELVFDADAFRRSGLRLLRLGQRVAIETEVTGRVQRLGIPGIG